ncbi:nucleotidyltransferase family protein [Selenomonas ruminantium]|uniref:nucleotidyltransferase family protein n=1 Tax=Selenomonas ruminantium TaxID=971 RepID=UPI00210CE7B7|nr:nucleotidyltransferase domain-containing protein [Selenomonas ruminantium]
MKLAHKYDVSKIILFGSRARGDNYDKSDVDIAVYGCTRFSQFSLDVDEEVWTLLTFDIVNMDAKVSDELKKEIERDGVIIYEKV